MLNEIDSYCWGVLSIYLGISGVYLRRATFYQVLHSVSSQYTKRPSLPLVSHLRQLRHPNATTCRFPSNPCGWIGCVGNFTAYFNGYHIVRGLSNKK